MDPATLAIIGAVTSVASPAPAAEQTRQARLARADAARERQAREDLEARVQRPRVLVQFGGSNGGSRAQRSTVGVRIENKGPTVASNVEYGVRFGDWSATAETVAALAVNEQRSTDPFSVLVPAEVVARLDGAQERTRQARVWTGDEWGRQLAYWARFDDPRGARYEVMDDGAIVAPGVTG